MVGGAGGEAEYGKIKFPLERVGAGRSWEHSLISNVCICHTEKES